jgi:hypothetical protein
MRKLSILFVISAAALAADGVHPWPVDGNYVEGSCGPDGQCIAIAACFTSDFAGEVKLGRIATFTVSLRSRAASPTNTSPGLACQPKMFRLLAAGEMPATGKLLLRVRTQREYVADVILLLRYVSSTGIVYLEPHPEG